MTREARAVLVALGAGVGSAVLVVGALAMRTGGELELRGAQIRRAAEGRGSNLEALLGAEGDAMRARLAAYAELAAAKHLADAYGATPARLESFARLRARLGVS